MEDLWENGRSDYVVYGREGTQSHLAYQSGFSQYYQTNPGPLGKRQLIVVCSDILIVFSPESILTRDPHIRSGVIFGRGRFHNGLIIDPVEEHAFNPRDLDKLKQFREKIWYALFNVDLLVTV